MKELLHLVSLQYVCFCVWLIKVDIFRVFLLDLHKERNPCKNKTQIMLTLNISESNIMVESWRRRVHSLSFSLPVRFELRTLNILGKCLTTTEFYLQAIFFFWKLKERVLLSFPGCSQTHSLPMYILSFYSSSSSSRIAGAASLCHHHWFSYSFKYIFVLKFQCAISELYLNKNTCI